MRARAAKLALRLRAAIRGVPDIGSNLPRRCDEAEPLFDARIKARFPLGTREVEVLDVLERQGFTRKPPSHGITSATFTRHRLVMKTIWSVRWRTVDGRITDIWGVHGAVAP